MKTSISALMLAMTMAGPALAETTDTLTVYTYDSFAADWGPGPAVKKAFEAECHCTLNLVALEDGVTILNRLRLEGKNSKADVILGLDTNLMAEAEKTGLLATHNVDTKSVTLPEGWSSQTFVPYDYGYFAFVYDKTKLTNPPKSLKELVEKRDDISVIYQDPRTSTPGQGLMLWMKSVYGDDVSGAWQQLAKKTVTVTKGWSEAYNMFLEGESDLVLSYTTSPAYHLIAEENPNFSSANFAEGHYMQVEVAAKVKSSEKQALADQFMQFILSDGFQNAVPTGQWMYPVTDIALPAGFDTLSVPAKSLQFTPENVADNRRTWIREWQSALVK
ncbi:thiamine ABC transporter substrate binding subunit [Grimontia hollisae]|uniref:Thiamin ABC transporter substrate-binding component n=1 Tax=Grimontia hollisae CIP 101886 TaxID=675812 RepID=D0I8F8_GRIHO|nr:thiamine ABC transporter substrate binding subunit [Grimontia hollisae]AMG30961.1 thiamine ABC transporter substrate binding subunit [Grimontia hollisae]EEY72927.1 thiamin ABC transporter substrate-binding component [Grimontia hollisae CIP 101886]STO47013.1 Thiamine-binding periplasmic protein precursor [Grimontia hollisae]